MKITLKPGKYVVAVSGGVDSVVLLDILSKQTNSHLPSPISQLFVAHFDHGIRSDSSKDEQFVKKLARQYGLDYFSKKGQLDPSASEEAARNARYKYLRSIKNQVRAEAIVTAHHQDDLIETAIINIIRGTGRKGLSSLKSTDEIYRPLLNYSKKQILKYAEANKLIWREDPTNKDTKYLRNYIRQKITIKIDNKAKRDFVAILERSSNLNREIDALIATLSQHLIENNSIDRRIFSNASHKTGLEIMAKWMRHNNLNFDSILLSKLLTFAKTNKINDKFSISKNMFIVISADGKLTYTLEK